MSNKKLYETNEVVDKYAAMTTRVRQLNIAERNFIDKFSIINQKVLVLGSGAGRVPANLLLFGNEVTGIELSNNLHLKANLTYPNNVFKRLKLLEGDATQLNAIEDNSFDLVFFPQNGIDLIPELKLREKALSEMSKKVKPGGLLAFASHNSIAYGASIRKYKGINNRKLLFVDYVFEEEKVVGGGTLFKGKPNFVIEQTKHITGFDFCGYTCDARTRLARKLAKKCCQPRYILNIFCIFLRNPKKAKKVSSHLEQ